jgi:hypothetical protein
MISLIVVAVQGELVQRIDEDIEAVDTNVNTAHSQLLRYKILLRKPFLVPHFLQ